MPGIQCQSSFRSRFQITISQSFFFLKKMWLKHLKITEAGSNNIPINQVLTSTYWKKFSITPIPNSKKPERNMRYEADSLNFQMTEKIMEIQLKSFFEHGKDFLKIQSGYLHHCFIKCWWWNDSTQFQFHLKYFFGFSKFCNNSWNKTFLLFPNVIPLTQKQYKIATF